MAWIAAILKQPGVLLENPALGSCFPGYHFSIATVDYQSVYPNIIHKLYPLVI